MKVPLRLFCHWCFDDLEPDEVWYVRGFIPLCKKCKEKWERKK
ncbi:MAG: hypothetical protein ACFFG0_04810 [Candidatus Thorarchaeota archaeon]